MSNLYFYEINIKGQQFKALSWLSRDRVFEKGLPSKAIIGIIPNRDAQLDPATFRPNPEFIEFLHEVIEKYGPLDPDLQLEARRQGQGWVYIIDGRTPNPQGEVPPEDIIGAFEVQAGRIVDGSYQRNQNHRILTKSGLFQLDSFLRDKLLAQTQSLSFEK